MKHLILIVTTGVLYLTQCTGDCEVCKDASMPGHENLINCMTIEDVKKSECEEIGQFYQSISPNVTYTFKGKGINK